MLDEENNTSDEDVSISDTRAIRKQLEGLENMYSEVSVFSEMNYNCKKKLENLPKFYLFI